jgi:hypothetical protein
MKYLIVFDGTLSAKEVLRYGLCRAQRFEAEVVVLAVFHAGLFVGYDGMHAESRARREFESGLQDVRTLIHQHGSGLQISMFSAEGDPEESILNVAKTEQVDLLLLSPRYRRLQRQASVPVAVIPGTLLLPVDSSHEALGIVDRVAQEALESGSSVVVLGVVPVHLYSRSESDELQAVHARTVSGLNLVLDALHARGINARSLVRSGYPDDEIIHTAAEISASSIIFPGGGVAPSELRKAAHVLLTDREHAHFPLLFVPQPGNA